MENEKYKDLFNRTAPLDMSAEQFKKLGYSLVDKASEFLSSIRDYPVAVAKDVKELKKMLDSSASLPAEGADIGEVLNLVTGQLLNNSLFNAHPRFWGYISASAAPIGILGDMFAAVINPNVGAYKLSPVATEIETQSVKWIAELISYPSDCGGILVSGGNMANFICYLAARTEMADWNIRQEGLVSDKGKRLLAYASGETHTWLQKAADLFGQGTNSIRWVETDDNQQMDMNNLKKQVREDISSGFKPFMVVGTGGSVSTGAIDPLHEISDFCKENNLWFHVDGAYGGFAAAVPGISKDLTGLSKADSVAVDPHKWLYNPLEVGCALVRDPNHLTDAFSYHPSYYNFDEDQINYFERGMQNSRGFKALKVWLAIKQVGKKGYQKMIQDDIRLAEYLFLDLTNYPNLQRLTNNLSITTFRYLPDDLKDSQSEEKIAKYLNELNQQLLEEIEKSGEIFLSVAMIGDIHALRICIVNFRTSLEDMIALPKIISQMGDGIDSELRTKFLG